MKDYTRFLKQVESLNTKYASIYFNCELEALTMPFWSWDEIQAGLALREEWEVSTSLIPFYGDWHHLLCVNKDSGEIVALNDNRDVISTWATTKEFLSCLSEKEIVYDDVLHTDDHFFAGSNEQEIKH